MSQDEDLLAAQTQAPERLTRRSLQRVLQDIERTLGAAALLPEEEATTSGRRPVLR